MKTSARHKIITCLYALISHPGHFPAGAPAPATRPRDPDRGVRTRRAAWLAGSRLACGLVCAVGMMTGRPAQAQAPAPTVVLFPTAPYEVVTLPPPAARPQSPTTLKSLSEIVVNNLGQSVIYVTGFTYPNASSFGVASAWTVNLGAGLPPLPLAANFGVPNSSPVARLSPLPAAATAYLQSDLPTGAFSYGVAVNTAGNGSSLHVGTTDFDKVVAPDGYVGTYSIGHATSWHLINGVYVPADMDVTGNYFYSSVNGIVQRSDNSVLAFGYGQNVNSQLTPLIWKLPQNANSFTYSALPPLQAGNFARIFGASKRSDQTVVVGNAIGVSPQQANGRSILCPAYWQGSATPISLIDQNRVQLIPPFPTNVISGGAYGVASFASADGTTMNDIVAGVVTSIVFNGRKSRHMDSAFVWLSEPGGGAPFNAIRVLYPATAGNGGVVIQNSGAAAVNSSQVVVGSVQFRLKTLAEDPQHAYFLGGIVDSEGWYGYVATGANGSWNGQMVVPDQNSQAFRIIAIKAINDSGILIASVQRGRQPVQDAILIPNPNNFKSSNQLLPAPAAN